MVSQSVLSLTYRLRCVKLCPWLEHVSSRWPSLCRGATRLVKRAGSRRGRIQALSLCAVRILNLLSKLSSNTELLGRNRYILLRLSKTKLQGVAKVKEAFITYWTARFMKQFSLHLPYGYREEYLKGVKELDFDRLAGLLRMCCFWCEPRYTVQGCP